MGYIAHNIISYGDGGPILSCKKELYSWKYGRRMQSCTLCCPIDSTWTSLLVRYEYHPLYEKGWDSQRQGLINDELL